jgi:hypothetical protein
MVPAANLFTSAEIRLDVVSEQGVLASLSPDMSEGTALL